MNLSLKISLILLSYCSGILIMAIYNVRDNYNNCRDDNIITVSYVIEQHKEWEKDCKSRIEKIETNYNTQIIEQECTIDCIRNIMFTDNIQYLVDKCSEECKQND